MKIIFDSEVVFDAKARAVRFAGYFMDEKGHTRFVVCGVSQDFLVERFKLTDPAPETLLNCYGRLREEIHALVARKAKLGDFRPVIRAQDLVPTL